MATSSTDFVSAPEQAVIETELAHQSHLLLEIGRRAEGRRRLRRVEHFGRAELFFVGIQRVLRPFGDGRQDFVGTAPCPDICASISYHAPASALANFCPDAVGPVQHVSPDDCEVQNLARNLRRN